LLEEFATAKSGNESPLKSPLAREQGSPPTSKLFATRKFRSAFEFDDKIKIASRKIPVKQNDCFIR
jgi:hypothetical protein